MKKSVCVVGAGPSGLVAAKVLLRTGKFDVTVFEKANRIGGIWALDESTTDGWLSPDTPTNLSRFSVSFSDLQWDHGFLREPNISCNGEQTGLLGSPVPMFPKAWQVNRYLETYRKRYIPDGIIKLHHKVIRTERIERSEATWRVTTQSNGIEETKDFDFLLFGSGFFSRPRLAVPSLSGLKDVTNLSVRVIHSSQFRSLGDLFPRPGHVNGKTILIIGSGNSSGETAAAIAQQLSNSQFSPDTSEQQKMKDLKIVHVTPRPIYALPPYHPTGEDSRTFVPLDFRFYDLSKRPAGRVVAGAGLPPQSLKDMMHSTLQNIVAGDQSDLGSPALTIPASEPRGAVIVALAESYTEFVRSGLIDVVRGRVSALATLEDNRVAASVKTDDGEINIDEIAAVVYATGFTPTSALDFLPDAVKDELRYDPESVRLPLILEEWQTMTGKILDLAFIGFYEGPYWGVMEMQARLAAARWLGKTELIQHPYEEQDRLLALRKSMQERALDVPQYWFGDYLGYMEELASHLSLQRNDGSFKTREGCTSPARYLSADSDKSQADAIIQDLFDTWQACTKEGRFVARAAFRALQGNWTIRRTIDSALASFPSGNLEGTASFHPRSPTPDKSGRSFDLEYLYIEAGTLTMSNGASMSARRRYVYRYSEAEDRLSVWFVKPDQDLEVDYLFHDLAFVPPDEARTEGACVARADHLCVEDMYWTEYRLPIKGVSLLAFETKHTVKGPSKDYVARTKYTRPAR